MAIVNDQRLATEALRRVVLSNPAHKIVWTAVDGEEAVQCCARDLPDVILMDLVMPVMNGAEATRRIMRQSPCPVLVVTATVSGNYSLVCEALGHGAYDAVCTPTLGDRPPAEGGAKLLAKLSSVDEIRHQLDRAAAQPPRHQYEQAIEKTPGYSGPLPLVAIGASTGGPQALERILANWPADFPAAVVVVQHIGADFAQSLVHWLAEKSPLKISMAAQGDSPQAGTVLVASTNNHLVIGADRKLAYTPEPLKCPYRPSVDVFFHSLADHWPQPSTAVVLTGIGRDGAKGLLELSNRGWHTI
ncbi:MAG: chemotaxis-specific protein-glutamate methyltransferase CheB, partial [Planctomycetota bacterium]|nr:chemotaxis-specific protein-glutamate methyltransferase CheB [Planctomycetota bacterium]